MTINTKIKSLTMVFASIMLWTTEAQAQDALDFQSLLLPVPATAKFENNDWYTWGGSVVEQDGRYHMFYSRWPRKLGQPAWLTHSEIAHAVADSPLGPFKHVDVALPVRGAQFWDGLNTHNPTAHKFDGKYYIYYTGNTGNGKATKGLNWIHRNNQRIGVAVANNPNGPWKRFDTPLIKMPDNPKAHDALMMANPSITRRPDGTYVLVYKCVGKKRKLPFGGPVVHMVATSKSPTGPFVKHPEPIFTAKGQMFPAEDPFIWTQDDMLWAIVKDFKGVFTKAGPSLALFQSKDGVDWSMAENPLVSTLQICWKDGSVQKVAHLERPQLLLKDGEPSVLYCAVDLTREHSFNVHIPLAKAQ